MSRLVSGMWVGVVCVWPVVAVGQVTDEMLAEISKPREIPDAKTYRVPMRDGAKLATDVTLPKGKPDGKWPVLLIRTPYNRRGLVGAEAAKIVPRFGLVSVVQDIRGRFGSEGEDFPIHGGCAWFKIQDGYDTIEWIAAQPWCNGKVGTFGPSAMGITQNLTLPTQPPHLTCAFVMVAASDVYTQGAYWGGAPRAVLAKNWTAENNFDRRNLDLFRAHPAYDEFWQEKNTEAQAHRVNVPVLYYGGWYDMFCQGTINSFVAAQTHGGPRARGQCRLIMGPWDHHGPPKDLQYPDNATPKLELWAMQWFQRHMRDVENPTGKKSGKPVFYYVMGACGEPNAPGNVWRAADTWPVPSERIPYYFGKDGVLSPDAPTGQANSATYRYDPKNPVPTRGGGNLTIAKGPMDQRPVENRPDVVLFTTPVLTKPVEVTGRITVKLWASSSCKDTDFSAKLCDVYPDGRSMLVLDGIVRARYRDSLSRPTLMTPGTVYEFSIDLWSTSLIFNKGHRIRVAISSSNAPRFGPNPNTGDIECDIDKAVVAWNTVYFDQDRPSHIILPRPVGAPSG